MEASSALLLSAHVLDSSIDAPILLTVLIDTEHTCFLLLMLQLLCFTHSHIKPGRFQLCRLHSQCHPLPRLQLADKLVAISGIAQKVAAVTKKRYLAGLWDDSNLAQALLWYVLRR